MRVFLYVFILIALCTSAAFSGTPSPCKGLDNAECGKAIDCGWVKSYKTKTGKVINAFCRKKGGFTKKTAASVPAPN